MKSNSRFTATRYLYRLRAILALYVVMMASASAQTSRPLPTSRPPAPQASPTPTPSLEKQFFKNILQDQLAIWTSPLHVHGEDAKWLAPLGISAAALIATDRRTASGLHDNRLRLNISRDISYLGSDFGAGTIAGSLYLIGRAR